MQQKPVIFLAFANDREDNARYLRNIPAEYNAIRQTLIAAQDRGLCEVEMLPYSTFQDIKNVFTAEKYRNRIAVFHFSGHADGFQLLLENAEGKNELAHGKGLVAYFSILKTQNIQKNLQLLFFNGCCTAQLGENLQSIIPAVIGTVDSVNDAQAKAIAVSFYENLAKQIGIKTSFDLAKAERHVGNATLRGLYRDELEGEPTAEPWQMYCKDERVLEWGLYLRDEGEKVEGMKFETLILQQGQEIGNDNVLQNTNAQAIEDFRSLLFQKLEKGFEATPDVFQLIEKCAFHYNKGTFADLKTQATQPLTALAPAGFIVALKSFILTIY